MQEEKREQHTGMRQKSAVHAEGVGSVDGSMMNWGFYCNAGQEGRNRSELLMTGKFATKIGRCTGASATSNYSRANNIRCPSLQDMF